MLPRFIEPTDDALARCLDESINTDKLAPTPVPLPFARGSKKADQLAGVVEQLLTPAECSRLIELTTQRGYEAAMVNIGGGQQRRMDDVRRSGRCIIDAPSFAREIWRRLEPLLPRYHFGDGDGRSAWVAVGLNERLRFLRYEEGDYFKPHQDGSYARPVGHPNYGDRSLVTLMIYLDSPVRGGETNFLNYHDKRSTSVAPAAGVALFFDHLLLHEGAAVREGTKHAVRSDIMFRRMSAAKPPPPAPMAHARERQTGGEPTGEEVE